MRLEKSGQKTYLRLPQIGMTILFSYAVPVAVAHRDGTIYTTEQWYSATTSAHINSFLGGRPYRQRPQAYFDNLLIQSLIHEG